jgi:hypothetical protein
MKTTLKMLTAALVAAQFALPLSADDQKEKEAAKDRQKEYPAATSDRRTDPTKPYDNTTAEPFGVVTKVKGVMGLEVRNTQNDKLGKVEDITMSFSSGRVIAVIVSVGGVLGVGDTLIAVPPSEFHYDADARVLHLNRTKDELKNAPKLDLAKWDEFHQPANLAEVYRYYGVKPYFHVDSDVNTTTRIEKYDANTRPNDNTPTALKQGNNESDLNMTARIRKDLLRHKELSTSAHNVTVITQNGRVTLKGKVDSEDEKRIVADIAKSAAPGAVDNLLEVSTANK